jgi:hypothetical protein
VGMDLKDMDWNLEEMTPEERNRIEYLVRVAKILRMPPDELIKECDEIMARKDKPEPIGIVKATRAILSETSTVPGHYASRRRMW